MRWFLFQEDVFKGLFLGLLLFVALLAPTWSATLVAFLCTLAGLVVCLGIAAWGKLREGYRATGRLPAFLLFLVLESPRLVYAGVILGMAVGATLVRKPEDRDWFFGMIVGGAALGVVFALLRTVRHRWFRLGLSFALAAGLVGAAYYWIETHPGFLRDPVVFGADLLLGLPVFYLLTFAGVAEESEVEAGAMCAALGLGVWTLTRAYFTYQSAAFLVPMALYFVYTRRFLPNIRVFKHVVRGIGFANVGRHRPALLAFRRALQLDPNNALARESLWSLHRSLDWHRLAQEPQTLELVDFGMCLQRVTSLLLAARPDEAQLKEAHHLLDLIMSQRPELGPQVHYWRAVAFTHAKQLDHASAELGQVLDRGRLAPDDLNRNAILFEAWQLALVLHPELKTRVGTPQLALPGRRLEAIAAVEGRLAANPEDQDAWTLKRVLYSELTEADYLAALNRPADWDGWDFTASTALGFDHGYAQQVGLALVNDPARWQRGLEFLRIAARGLPAQAALVLQEAAKACERHGRADDGWRYYELAKQAGRAVGPANLADPVRQAYFAIVKQLGDRAREQNDLDRAVENYQLYTENDRSGLETLRVLAELHEKKGNALEALRVTERALLFNNKDKDLLERKDRYYYSVMPDQLRAHLDGLRQGFDVAYCMKKARSLLDLKNADLDLVDWAQHLVELALVVKPESVTAKVLRSRALRRRGEIDQVQALLEETRANKPQKFADGEEEESWYLCCRLLGELYLYEKGRPDLAVPCFTDYRQSSKSGADTMYKLGQAYEQLGDRARAVKCYEHVTSYESHPLAPDAREALYRLKP